MGPVVLSMLCGLLTFLPVGPRIGAGAWMWPFAAAAAVSAVSVSAAFADGHPVYSAFSLPWCVALTWIAARFWIAPPAAAALVIAAWAADQRFEHDVVQLVLPVMCAAGVAVTFSRLASPAVIAGCVVGLAVIDLALYSCGVLERLVPAGADAGIELHGALSVTVSGWTLGTGDLVACACCAALTVERATSWRAGAAVAIVVGMLTVFWAAEHTRHTVPATGPMAAYAIVFLACSAAKRRRALAYRP